MLYRFFPFIISFSALAQHEELSMWEKFRNPEARRAATVSKYQTLDAAIEKSPQFHPEHTTAMRATLQSYISNIAGGLPLQDGLPIATEWVDCAWVREQVEPKAKRKITEAKKDGSAFDQFLYVDKTTWFNSLIAYCNGLPKIEGYQLSKIWGQEFKVFKLLLMNHWIHIKLKFLQSPGHNFQGLMIERMPFLEVFLIGKICRQ